MAFGLIWALLLTFQPAPGADTKGILDPITKLIEALAKLADGLAKVLGTRFGAPMLVFGVGVGLYIWDTV